MSDEELIQVANEVRRGVVIGTHAAKSGHPGGSLGAADIITYLYFEEMNVDPADPRRADRDRFVLSKGHCAPALYAALAERGFFPKEDLESLRHVGCHLQGHPNMNDTPGVDMSTGSLGQGVSAAVGMALAAEGISVEVVNMHTVKPLDEDTLLASAAKTGHVVTVEEHSVIGGLGEACAAVLCEKGPVPMRRVGVQDVYGESGPALELLDKYGLNAEGIAAAVREVLA